MKNLMKIMLILGLMATLVLAGCQKQAQEPEMNDTPEPEPEPEPEPSEQVVDVTLDEWGIQPGTIRAEAGSVKFEVSNSGNLYHEFEIEGNGVEAVIEDGIPAGETRNLQLDLEPGTYEVYCPIPGNPSHTERGMEATLVVE